MPSRKRIVATRKKAPPRASGHPRKLPIGRAETAAVARLRAICLALPGAEEKIAWGESTWRAGKIFAQMDTHHHGADHVAVWLPARPGVQEALVAENPEQFFRPPYVGHKGWVGVRIDRKPDWDVVAGLVTDAYREVAAPRLQKQLEADRSKPARGWRASWLPKEDEST
jgi:predicted DNA-binding protein (MmcQ/YjbR family)